jgi:Ser/Thr protein kinase RdoA (MazF antagonist)
VIVVIALQIRCGSIATGEKRMQLSKQLVEKNWPLTDVSVGQVLQEFGERVVTVITAKEGRFVTKVSDQWRSEDVSAEHASIFDFLKQKNFEHVPRILKTKTGRNYQNVHGHPVYILEFIDGREPPRTKANCRRLGEIAGSLHTIRGYPYSYLFSVADVMPELYEIASTLPFGQEYEQIVRTLPDFEALPDSLIHGEILGNCVERPDGGIVIIDWDEAGIGTRVLDLGHPLVQAFLSEDLEFEEENARAFYEGYFSRNSLDDREIDHVFDAGLFYALRYIIYGNTDKRWKRVQFAVENRELLESIIRESVHRAPLYSD